jgi:hypothetical protein
MVVKKSKTWEALALALFMNSHSVGAAYKLHAVYPLKSPRLLSTL